MNNIIKFRRGSSQDRILIIPEEGETPGGILIINGCSVAKKTVDNEVSRNLVKFIVRDREDII